VKPGRRRPSINGHPRMETPMHHARRVQLTKLMESAVHLAVLAQDARGPVRPIDPLDRTWILLPLGQGSVLQKNRSNTNLTRSNLGSNRTSPFFPTAGTRSRRHCPCMFLQPLPRYSLSHIPKRCGNLRQPLERHEQLAGRRSAAAARRPRDAVGRSRAA
jgi:hypothetical protein